MEPYPQSPEMEQFFTMFRIATLPTRLHVHPSPEIEAWDTESHDANYDQIEVVVVEVVGAAATYSPRNWRDHTNLIDRWECNASIGNPPLGGIHKAYDRGSAIGWKRVLVHILSLIKSP